MSDKDQVTTTANNSKKDCHAVKEVERDHDNADADDKKPLEHPPLSSRLHATPEMCYHCFDKLIFVLMNDTRQTTQQKSQQKFIRGFFTTTATSSSSSSSSSSSLTSSSNRHVPSSTKPALPSAALPIPQFIQDLPDISTEAPIFVTWDITNSKSKQQQQQQHWKLRGCIGTLGPRLIADAVGEYAIISALKDRRFEPIRLSEIQLLRCSVSLLVNYEPCDDVYDWIVGKHGIMIKFYIPESSKYYNATYLPEVASQQGWDTTQTVSSLIQKAGYYGTVTPELIQSIQCTRYQSSKCTVTFHDYLTEHCHGQDPTQLNYGSDDNDDNDGGGTTSLHSSSQRDDHSDHRHGVVVSNNTSHGHSQSRRIRSRPNNNNHDNNESDQWSSTCNIV